MKNWQRFFRTRILERGYGYARNDAVLSIKETKQGYRAVVSGSENYDVLIEVKNGKIVDMSCSCPYADSGNSCKHMAAVLFVLTGDVLDEEEYDDDYEDEFEHDRYYEDRYGYDMYEDDSEHYIDEYDLQESINLLTLKEARELLYEFSMNNHRLAEKVISAAEKIESRHRLLCIFEHDTKYWGKQLNTFLSADVTGHINRGDAKFAVELLCELLKLMDEKKTDFDLSEVIQRCFEMIISAIENSAEYLKSDMVVQCQKMINAFKNESLLKLSDAFLKELRELDPRVKKLHELDHLIQQVSKQSECPTVIGISYQPVEAVLYRIDLMKELGYSREEIAAYKAEMRHFSVIRCMEIKEALAENNASKALEIVAESRKLDRYDKSLQKQYNQYAIEAYRMLNDEVNLIREMKNWVLHTPQFGLDYIHELRHMMSPKEWDDFVPKLLKSDSAAGIRIELMIEAGMKDEVFAQIQFYHQFLKYEDELKELDIHKAQERLIEFLENMAAQGSKRDEYRNLFYQLMKLGYYPGGHDEIYRIAQNWKIMYKKRPAMMEELSFAFRKWKFLKQCKES